MELIKLDGNEILSERAGYKYWPNKAYEYVVCVDKDMGNNFFIHRVITATSAQEAQLMAAKEVHKFFQPIVTPRTLPGFNTKKYSDLGYSSREIVNLIDEYHISPSADKDSDRRDSRMNESYMTLRVQLWDDKDIKIQYPKIYEAHEQITDRYGQMITDFSLVLELRNDCEKANKDSYKGNSFDESLDKYPKWWDIELDTNVQSAYPRLVDPSGYGKVDGIVYKQVAV